MEAPNNQSRKRARGDEAESDNTEILQANKKECSKTRAATEESLHLPEEIIREILVRLPVKSILRFRCVSKSWLSLIDSKRFIETHLQYSTKNQRVIICNDWEPKQCSLQALLEEPGGTDLSPVGHQIPLEFVFYPSYCNGLVCFYRDGRFILLNLSTRVSKELPEDPETETGVGRFYCPKYGLGWDESSCAYKVFTNWKGMGRVYSSKRNSWKTVEDPHPRSGKEGRFVGGKLHWPSNIISSFDLKTETFGTIELPVHTNGECYLNLTVVGGCLCLSADYYGDPQRPLDVWVMKESWVKLPTIYLTFNLKLLRYHHRSFSKCSSRWKGPGTHLARVIGEAANGEILIAYGTSFWLVYCPRNGTVTRPNNREMDSFIKASIYVESLVSPIREITSI